MTKLVTVHPENARSGLPTIQGEVVVMEAGTGMRLGILDGSVVTARRTAALSLLAARELALRPNGPLLIVGSGTQGRAHLEAFHEGLGTSRVFVNSRTEESARSLAEHAENLGMEARVVGARRRSVRRASWSRPRLAVSRCSGWRIRRLLRSCSGLIRARAAELPAGLVARAAVVVDTLEGAREEAGDLIQAEKAGAFSWGDVTQLEDVLRNPERPEGTVVFKSVGHALWDLAAARTVFGG